MPANVVTCPDCGKPRGVSDQMRRLIANGGSTGRCRNCSLARVRAKKVGRPKVTHTATCPDCGECRRVSASVACGIRKGTRLGLCQSCAAARRKAARNSGQFPAGHKPANKCDDRKAVAERRRVAKLKWRRRNAKKVRDYFREYYRKNANILRPKGQVYAMRRRAIGEITPDTVAAVVARQTVGADVICYLCSKPCVRREIDHVVPIAKGGTNDVGNLRAACRTCNRRKWTKDVDEFIKDSSHQSA